MKIHKLVLGPFQTNCFVLANDQRQALIIDPSDEAEEIIRLVDRESLAVAAILLTHAHVDHTQALPALAETYKVPVALHPAGAPIYTSPINALPPILPALVNPPETVAAIDPMPEGLVFEILHTPGHSPGGVAYYFRDSQIAFVGDTLFQGSIGRHDLPGGDFEQLIQSIKTILLPLGDETTIYPGHGPKTSIGQERKYNPFL